MKDIYFDISLYNKNGCVIGSTIDRKSFGYISNVS